MGDNAGTLATSGLNNVLSKRGLVYETVQMHIMDRMKGRPRRRLVAEHVTRRELGGPLRPQHNVGMVLGTLRREHSLFQQEKVG